MLQKSLLMTVLALASTFHSFAFEVGDYAYTGTQRFKITQGDIVQNGSFADGLNTGGWCGASMTEQVNASAWTLADGQGPMGEKVLKSLGVANSPLCNVWSNFNAGQKYLVSFMIKGGAKLFTTTGATVGSNYVDFFLNSDGSLNHTLSEGVTDVAKATYFDTEWKTVSFAFTAEGGKKLVMHFENLASGTMITNFSIHQVNETFNDRIVQGKMVYSQGIMKNSNFKNSATEDAYDNFYYGVYSYVKDQLETPGAFDDPYGSASLMEQFDYELASFMNASSSDMAKDKYFKYVDKVKELPAYGSGDIKNGETVGGFIFRGDNWQHTLGDDALVKLAVGDDKVGPGSVALYSKNFVPGKYFIAADVRNANCNADSVLSWDLERNVQMFIGSDTVECGNISGEHFKRVFCVANLKEGEPLEAGLWWDGPQAGARLEVKNFELRVFGGSDIENVIERNTAWNEFITQYNAAAAARQALVDMSNAADCVWGKDSLQRAFDQWDSYFNGPATKNWLTSDGKDASIATNDELYDWALYQGVEKYDGQGNLLKNQLVSGYQSAVRYVESLYEMRKEMLVADIYYNAIKDSNPEVASTLLSAIQSAQAVGEKSDATQEDIDAAMAVLVSTKAAAVEIAGYMAAMADGTDDAENWKITPSVAKQGANVTITYTGKKKLIGIKVVKQ